DRVALTLDGGVLAVVGPNGCGKTTLLRIVAGVLAPDEGDVLLDGRRLDRARLGYVPEAADPPAHLTVDALLALDPALRRPAPRPAAGRARPSRDRGPAQRQPVTRAAPPRLPGPRARGQPVAPRPRRADQRPRPRRRRAPRPTPPRPRRSRCRPRRHARPRL